MSKKQKNRVRREIRLLLEEHKFLEEDIKALERPEKITEMIKEKQIEIDKPQKETPHTILSHRLHLTCS